MTFDKIKSSSIGSQLMSIPGDILGRLGLNLSVLSPAKGSIDFAIENRRVIITKMRDVIAMVRCHAFTCQNPRRSLTSILMGISTSHCG